jgi:rhodanese-related sulfurtransferase
VLRVLRDASLIAAGCALLGLAFNAARPHGLPLIARQAYAILVPCPEVGGEATALAPADPRLTQPGTLVLDARSPAAFAAWHLPQAKSLPYDYLASVAQKQIQAILDSSPTLVAAYGDGEDPDSGRELAKEIGSKGIRNVFYVEGGAPALGAKKP